MILLILLLLVTYFRSSPRHAFVISYAAADIFFDIAAAFSLYEVSLLAADIIDILLFIAFFRYFYAFSLPFSLIDIIAAAYFRFQLFAII